MAKLLKVYLRWFDSPIWPLLTGLSSLSIYLVSSVKRGISWFYYGSGSALIGKFERFELIFTFFIASWFPWSLCVDAAIVLPEPCFITLRFSTNSGLSIIWRHLSSSNLSKESRGDFEKLVLFPSVSLKRSDCSIRYFGDWRFFVRNSFSTSNGLYIGLSVTKRGPPW